MRIIFMQATWFTIPVLCPLRKADLPRISIDVASRKVRSKSKLGCHLCRNFHKMLYRLFK